MNFEFSDLDRWYLRSIEPTVNRFSRHIHIGSSSPPGTSFYTVDTEKYPHMLPHHMAQGRLYSTLIGFPVALLQEGVNKINNPHQIKTFVDKHPVETIILATLLGLIGIDLTKSSVKRVKNYLQERES